MKKIKILWLILLSLPQIVSGQTMTGSITQQPCNNDGIYSVSTTGLPLPITYTYYFDNTSVVHTNINSTMDQLTNIGISNSGYIYCIATSGGLSAYTQTSYIPAFTFILNGTSPVCPATIGTAVATQQSGTPGPFTFDWMNNTTLNTYAGNPVNLPVGDYSVEITDQTTGCVLQINDTALYISQLSNISLSMSTTIANCTNGTATVVPSGGVSPYTYLWANGATTSSITGLTQGTYEVVATDAQGCMSNVSYAYIQQNPFIGVNTTVTNATCTQNDGSALAFGSGGVPPYSYAWSDGQTGNNAINLTGNTSYTILATDANGCIGQGYAYVNSTTPINVTYTSVPSQCTSATGSATLAVSGGTAPYTYDWSLNPSVTGPTISNLSPGSYSFVVTDAVGCVRSGSVVISPVSTLNGTIQTSIVVCPNTTGSALVSASGSNPPFTYLWNNGATTNQLSGVTLGGYTCVITDALGCSITKYGQITSSSPINIAMSTVPATCVFATDGIATASVTGGVAPYTYSYTSGATTANASGLGVGDYWLTVTDANGCSKSKHFWITNANTNQSCYCTISGNVYVDVNANCVYDAAETGIENIMVHCSGYGYTFTDAAGYYSFQVPTGTYTITEQINQYYPLSPCQNASTNVSVVAGAGCTTQVDIANDTNTIRDLKILTVNSSLPPIPGNPYQQTVIVKNQGTVTENAVRLGYTHDDQIPLVSATLPSFIQLNSSGAPYNYSVQTGFPILSPNASSSFLINYLTPTNLPINTLLTFEDTVAGALPIVTNWLLDYTPWNNVNYYQSTVIGSYDPNYKEVSPKGVGNQGYISTATTEFDYCIHFQNEGTYFAQNIVVTDQLDDDFDWTTLKPGYSDYEYTTNVSETGLVTFTFANINLPWKDAYGDLLSSGLVNYSIERKSTTPLGTEFTNTANIYFDYNAPITTNTTLNTLNDSLAGTGEIESPKISYDAITVEFYPVPADDYLTVRVNNILKSESATVSVIDIMGNVVMTSNFDLTIGSTAFTHDVSNLASGTYLSRVQLESGVSIVKKIVLH